MLKEYCVAISVGIAAALIASSGIAAAQTGRVPILCTAPNNAANRVGFDLDYDGKTVIGKGRSDGKLLGVKWDDDTIEWAYECVNRVGYICEHNYFNRRTGVLTQVLAPDNSGTSYVCAKAAEKMF